MATTEAAAEVATRHYHYNKAQLGELSNEG
jgi:hypothetical protein